MGRGRLSQLASRLLAIPWRPAEGAGPTSRCPSSASGGGGASASGGGARFSSSSSSSSSPAPALQAAQQRFGARHILTEPVSLPRGLIVVGGAALLAGGAALDRLARHPSADQLAALSPPASSSSSSAPSSGSSSGTSGGGGVSLLRPLADLLPSVLSFSHAHAAEPAPRPARDSSLPLGGCLSPFFISDAAAKAAPAVVNITVSPTGALPIGSSGSGFIVNGADGTILTNAHVVSDAIQRQQYPPGGHGGGGSGSGNSGGGGGGSGGNGGSKGITVTLQDGRIFDGRLVSYDTVSDLAVIRVDADAPLPTARLGRSASLRVGEWVVALGSPLHLQNSVTAGIVSCVDRKAVELGLAGARTDYIQTDAAINKGNSGGPLVNLLGEVVGISAMKAVAADGVSFAIPIDSAVEVMAQLAERGRVVRAYLGIKMLQLTKHNAAQFRRRDANFPPVDAGILVPGVHPGSPAERAGLRAGDVIIGFGDRASGDAVTTAALIKALGAHIGRPLALRVARPGDVVETLTVVAIEAGDGH